MPGPAPAFRPCFPDDFVARATLVAHRRTEASCRWQRARLVLLLHEQPALSNVEAGLLVGLHPDSVRLWRKRWAQGHFILEDRPGRGRKPVFSPLG